MGQHGSQVHLLPSLEILMAINNSNEFFKLKNHFIKLNCSVTFGGDEHEHIIFNKNDIVFVIDIKYTPVHYDPDMHTIIVLSNEFLVYERCINKTTFRQNWFEVID